MGIPTSALFAEIFLQWLEHMFIVTILSEHHILGYYRYVNDILILYNPYATHIGVVLTEFNRLHPSLTFTLENEINSSIKFLDLAICNISWILEFKIFRKPTTTDLVIHNDSYQYFEHKVSAY
jgi:hypothetical protein